MPFFNDAVTKELDKGGSSFYEILTGDNQFRIVSDFAWGLKYSYEFREEGKEAGYPFYRMDDESIANSKHKMNLTASMIVYDYTDKALKPFNIHQKKILKDMQAYVENDKYGDPTGYDFILKKTGEGRESRYQLIANPPEKASKELLAAADAVTINMENVFEGRSAIEEN